MKITDLIHEQTCRIDSLEERVRSEKGYLSSLQSLQIVINLYKSENPSQKFYPWCVDRGHALDFDCDVMDIIDKVKIN